MSATENQRVTVNLTVNGRAYERTVEPRRALSDFLREDLELTGTHVACEHGFCGVCNILVDGQSVRSCLLFAVQMEGASIQTVESLAAPDGTLSPLQQAFNDHAGLQCGYCTPGMLMTATEYLAEHPDGGTDDQIREAISGVLCRCTGYQQIIESIRAAGSAAKGA